MGYEFVIRGNASFSVISLGVVLTEDINSCCGIRRKSMKRKVQWKAFDKSGRTHGYLGIIFIHGSRLIQVVRPYTMELFPLNWNDKTLLL